MSGKDGITGGKPKKKGRKPKNSPYHGGKWKVIVMVIYAISTA